MQWIFLTIAILSEIVATSLLKLSSGFTKLIPGIFSVILYIVCFYFLSLALKKLEIGPAYAIWSASGIVILTVIGIMFFNESTSLLKIVSIFLIILGVIGVNLSGVSH